MLHQLDEDFVGVKIGDVNNTAVANATMQAEERTTNTAIFDIEDRDVKAGEEFEVSFKSAQALKGFQFTATLNGLKAVDVVKGQTTLRRTTSTCCQKTPWRFLSTVHRSSRFVSAPRKPAS
jgi:hypothetical protein